MCPGSCVFFQRESCELSQIELNQEWCRDACGDSLPAKLAMLRRVGISVPEPPAGVDLLAWVHTHGVRKNALTPEQQAAETARREEEEARRQALLAELPGDVKLALNFVKHQLIAAVYFAQTKRYYVAPAWEALRLAICEACPDGKKVRDDNGVLRCVRPECGCYLDNPNGRAIAGKCRFEALRCEGGHWDALDRRQAAAAGIMLAR